MLRLRGGRCRRDLLAGDGHCSVENAKAEQCGLNAEHKAGGIRFAEKHQAAPEPEQASGGNQTNQRGRHGILSGMKKPAEAG